MRISLALEQSSVLVLPMPSKGSVAFRDLQQSAMSYAEAMEVLEPLGLGQVAVRQWIGEGIFRSVHYVRRGALTYIFIDRVEVNAAQRFLQSLVSWKDLMSEHQIDRPTCQALEQTALLRSRVIGTYSRLKKKNFQMSDFHFLFYTVLRYCVDQICG